MRKKRIIRISAGLIVALGFSMLIAQAQEAVVVPKATGKCAGLDYQQEKCQCAKGQKHQPCPCKKCSADKQCACVAQAKKSTGTISGTIKLFKAIAKTKGPKSSKDVVVYLEKVANNNFPAPVRPALIDQKGLVFIPHVLVVQKGTPIEFRNSDNDKHNIYFLYDEVIGKKKKTKTMDLGTWMPGQKRSYTFKKSKEVITLCKLHLEMAAYVVVLDNPFFTMTSIDAKTRRASFTIKNVPPGRYVLKTWHKKLKLKGGSQAVTVVAGKTTNLELTITKAKYAKKKI